MLRRLYISHYALIDELDITFERGFSVITGETGAGKSIILGALGLLLGQRADSKSIMSGKERCIIEAHFDLGSYHLEPFFTAYDLDYDGTDTILRRELTAAGKSRAFINDSPVSLAIMRELGDQLVDIHSQHQNLLLNKEDFQLEVVDIIAQNSDLLRAYQTAYKEYMELSHQLDTLRQRIQKSRDNEDFLRFQHHELSEAHLDADEQDALEQQSETMTHAEDIKSALYDVDTILNGDDNVCQQLRRAIQSLSAIGQVFPSVGELVSRLESCNIELKDIGSDISGQMDRVDFDPSELERVNNRLDELYRLQQKYHVDSVGALITILHDLEAQLSGIDNSDEEVKQLESSLAAKYRECESLASRLSQSRRASAQQVESEMRERLVPLGIPHVKFAVNLTTKPLGEKGADSVSFLFSANSKMPLQPVSQVASGGEIARVMLSLKAMISGAVKLPTIIFDEIDTGVSGHAAERMAKIMHEMGSRGRQVISITHLPQIAAMGSHHYLVYKDDTPEGTNSHMRLLNDEERIREIAQMLSGSTITEAALNNAQELITLSKPS